MSPFPLRIVFTGAAAAVFAMGMAWLDRERSRLFGYTSSLPLFVLPWLAVVPVLILSGRISTALARMDHEGSAGLSPPHAFRVVSPYRARAPVLVVVASTFLFFWNAATINTEPFPLLWMAAVGSALVLPPLLPPRRVGTLWTEDDYLRVVWEDDASFRVPLRSLDRAEEVLDETSFPFERFGRGTWRPLVLCEADESQLRQIIEEPRRSRAPSVERPNDG